MKKLLVISSLSGGGKSTYAKDNFAPQFILPDTNVKVYEIYHKLFRGPSLEQNIPVEKLTGLSLWSAKYSADIAYLDAVTSFSPSLEWIGGEDPKDEFEFINMRSGWDFLIYDELWQHRKIMPEDVMHSQIKDIEDRFDEVEYLILHMQDEKIISELMSRNDDRSNLFNNDPVEYHRWQNHYLERYVSIMKKYNYKYTLKEVTYT